MRAVADPIHRRYRMTPREWLLVLLAAVFAHVLFFFLFRPLPNQISESNRHLRYIRFLDENDQPAISRLDDLRYWLRYTEPERLLKPDFENGFSLICGRNEVSIPDPDRFSHRLYETLAVNNRVPEKVFPVRSPADFPDDAELTPVPFRGTSPDSAPLPERYPVWTDEQGSITYGLFRPDAAFVRLAKSSRADRPSVLCLTLQPNRFPRVKMLSSCGDPRLDMLAVRQLKARYTDPEGHQKAAVKYFTVYWKMPDLETIRKEPLR
ncbi:MAG: hypothetical protein J5806_09805 [Lentisphaeria bacterium]|nr:hypothetical protein [Lentisphaeria bacterium]